MNYHLPFTEDTCFHVFSRAVGKEILFKTNYEYDLFLNKFFKYISPVAEIISYSLLPNHFHFMITIKSYNEILRYAALSCRGFKEKDAWLPAFVCQQFSNLLNSYAKIYNKNYERKGSLFTHKIRRVPIISDGQYTSTVFYLHKNPVHHGYVQNIGDWKFSSYNIILNKKHDFLEKTKVISWFGGVEKFIHFHSQPVSLKNAVVIEY